jgi:tetratricopeptide (TPR) repeat protein
LESLGRADEALPRVEEGLAMRKRLFGDRDHPEVALSTNNLAACLESLGRAGEALPRYEQALAMMKRLYGDLDHPEVAANLNNVATALKSLGRVGEALPQYEQALAMQKRLYGDRDHPNVARGLNAVAACLESLGRAGEALPQSEAAMAMIERLRNETRLSPELRQSLFEDLKSGSAFEQFQRLANQVGRPMDAMYAAERSRGRGLLDQLEQLADPEIEAERRARQRGDEAGATRLGVLRHDLEAAHAESDRLLHEATSLAEADVPDRESRREALLVQSNATSTRLRQLLDERARLLGDVLPVGRVRTPSDIQSILQPEELLLEFTVTRNVAMLYVLAREGAVEVLELPNAFATTQRLLPALLQRSSHAQLRGRDPEPGAAPATATGAAATELFASLIPPSVWDRVRKSRRVFIAAHRDLHRVPFELLVTSMQDGKPAYWLDEGPPISYVPSGTVLHWLRQRAKEGADDQTSLELLAVGDPRALDAEPLVPEQGVFVVKVNDGGEGARIGLQPGDVLTSYDGQSLTDDKSLRYVVPVVEAAIEDKKRDASPIELEVWRRGAMVKVAARPGKLGIEVGVGRARAAFEASLGSAAQLERITRAGDLERLNTLPPLLGARAETEAIEKVFADKKAKTKRLLSADATEPAVFDLAAKAKYLHFACHGIAEEYAGQSLSMLVLSPPHHVLPADDGLLKLADLWNTWRGRLSSCRLVVLSACRTNVGTTQRDEAPQALPLGFFFAGVPSVISSLWAVDDQSTRELMTDFYGRLLAGETDKLKAFTDARKALRAKYPDPFHWAPFLFLGAPE